MVQQTQSGDQPTEVLPKQDERRSKPRLNCEGVAELIVLDIGFRRTGNVLDLSVHGCCIETSTPMPPIERRAVEVVFTVDHVTLRLPAGIQFTKITERKAEQIEDLVKELFHRESKKKPVAAPVAGGAG